MICLKRCAISDGEFKQQLFNPFGLESKCIVIEYIAIQRPNMTKVELISDPQIHFDYLASDSIDVLDVNLISDDVVELHYGYDKNFVKSNAKTNVVMATFATAYARLKLYDVLDLLQERVLYYDTDSVIFISRTGESEPSTGNYLGDLTNELKQGDNITTFISRGPENYFYKTANNKIETKVRDITLIIKK